MRFQVLGVTNGHLVNTTVLDIRRFEFQMFILVVLNGNSQTYNATKTLSTRWMD